MDVRTHMGMVFHLDKCIGCHTCSVACKNIWTDRKGAEYMWWNNVETKPGTGYPTKWEDQEIYQGGWEREGSGIGLKGAGKKKGLLNIFHNPALPVIDDYYEPFTYRYSDLIEAPSQDDQPTARPVSLITGKPMDIKMGPNWDDDLGGSKDFARKDPNLATISEADRQTLFQLERLTFFYLPRICNHCMNPACVASCPSGAIYKRGEDGIVLINQDVCRAWRMCITACPYKKSYYNWFSGKSEKCILCYPRIEAGYTPACMHSCVGRIRYLGMLLYDADKIQASASANDADLVDYQREMILDPNDPEVVHEAKRNGVADSSIEAARRSPVYRFVKEWKLALPLHPEFRTLPMLFYVPPLLPVMARLTKKAEAEEKKQEMPEKAKVWKDDWIYRCTTEELWGGIEDCRVPLGYLASLFSAGDTGRIQDLLKRLMAVRIHRRHVTVGDVSEERADAALRDTGLDARTADAIFRLTSLASFDQRFVVPASHREMAIEMLEFTGDVKGNGGFGKTLPPKRGL